MRDSQYDGQSKRDQAMLVLLAAEAVGRFAAKEVTAGRVLSGPVIDRLTAAILDPDTRAFDAIGPVLRRMRISNIDLSEVYFPQIARNLGCDWEADRVTFVQVSSGLARMQSLQRQFCTDWAKDESQSSSAGRLLLILPNGEQHSFGPMVLLGQLRRSGFSVCLKIAPQPSELRSLLKQDVFDGVLLSVACREKLDACRSLLKTIKNASHGRLCVAVGGAVLASGVDVMAATGADIVTNDPATALAAFGLLMRVGARELKYA